MRVVRGVDDMEFLPVRREYNTEGKRSGLNEKVDQGPRSILATPDTLRRHNYSDLGWSDQQRETVPVSIRIRARYQVLLLWRRRWSPAKLACIDVMPGLQCSSPVDSGSLALMLRFIGLLRFRPPVPCVLLPEWTLPPSPARDAPGRRSPDCCQTDALVFQPTAWRTVHGSPSRFCPILSGRSVLLQRCISSAAGTLLATPFTTALSYAGLRTPARGTLALPRG